MVMPRMAATVERRKLLDDDEEGPPQACRFLVVVWPDRRLAYHMVRTRQMALLHFKEDYTAKVNMQSGYRLMMLVPPDGRGVKPDVYGFIIFRLEDQVVSVVQIAIADEHRGKGFGRQAVDWLIHYAENQRCESVVLGSALESVEFYEECGFERATAATALPGGKELATGVLPMEYRRGTRKAMAAKRRELSRDELLARVFDILDADCDGRLNRVELRRYAGWSGFSGGEEQWAEEYARICADSGAKPDVGIDAALFTKLINDRSEAGMFIDNDGLRDMLTQLQVQTPAHLRRKTYKTTPEVVETSRKDLVQAVFKLCDVDRDGLLSAPEMRTFALQTGAEEMDEAHWKDEYNLLCSDNGADPAKGISVQLLEKMVSDKGDNGCYCDDDELKAIRGALELEVKERAMKASMRSTERIGLVQQIFHVLDADRDGRLSEPELRAFADHLGFKGNAAEWAEEYQAACGGTSGGAGSQPAAVDLGRFEGLVNDNTESGWFCTEDELRRILADLASGPPRPRPAPEQRQQPQEQASRAEPSAASSTASGAAGAPSSAASAEPATSSAGGASRKELIRIVFDALQRCNGGSPGSPLGEAQMRRFAVFTGFDGTEEEWSEEFRFICSEGGNGCSSIDFDLFAKLVDDEGDGGCYCEDSEMRTIIAELSKESGGSPS